MTNSNTNCNVHVVIGTKAQLIKMAPVLQRFQAQSVPYNLVFTGQHRETFSELRSNFGIKEPDSYLVKPDDVVSKGQMALWLFKALYVGIVKRKKIFGKCSNKDLFLVHGDTFSTLLGAIFGRLVGAQVCHVESGLRSFNIFHPFPEELVRLAVFRLSIIYYCPGEWALKNLERYNGKKVNTGANTLLDSLRYVISLPRSSQEIPEKPFVITTIHRFENIFNKDRLEWIVSQLELVAEKFQVVFVLHPPTKKQLISLQLYERIAALKTVTLCPRYDYMTFVGLLQECEFVISDGGSNQEECSYLGVPCLLMRSSSERQEGLGRNVVLSMYQESAVQSFMANYKEYRVVEVSEKVHPSQVIVDSVKFLTTVL